MLANLWGALWDVGSCFGLTWQISDCKAAAPPLEIGKNSGDIKPIKVRSPFSFPDTRGQAHFR